MKSYRIDNRKLKIGDVLNPQEKYQAELTGSKKCVEDILEKCRPETKPKRKSVLMLFEDFNDSRNHWVKQKDAIFYQTAITENEILHKGDYEIVEQIYCALNNQDIEKATILANDYWDGKMTENPIVEIFVSQSDIDKIISDSEEQRKQELKIKHSNAFGAFKPDSKIKRVTEEE
jgi:hypothetical protein